MTSKISYPHPELTKLDGTPTAATIQLLIKQVYSNTRSVPSDLGGANNGYLGIAMPAAAYLTRAGEAFVPPEAVGTQPEHPNGVSAAAITSANRAWDDRKTHFREYIQVRTDITQQILKAVDPVYFLALEDPLFGFADVTIVEFIAHLLTTYGVLDAVTLETNRDRLKEQWNPDEPFENFWLHIKNVRAVAASGEHPISDFHTMSLAQTALRQAGVYDHAISQWYDKLAADQTWTNFVLHFNHHEKKRKESLTAQNAGFHGANRATGLPPPHAPPALIPDAPPTNAFHMSGYYCWSHGLSNVSQHTSATCNNKREGHIDDATAYDIKGGTQRFNFRPRSTLPRRPPRAPSGT
jgi:hypothetical protein